MRKSASAESVWQRELNMWLAAYRTTPHSSTGVPPAQLVFKFNYTQRLAQLCATRDFYKNDDDDIAVENDKAAKAYMKLAGDKRLRAVKCDLEVGDSVLYKEANKHLKKKTRPRRLVENFEVTSIKGSMVTVRSKQGKLFTRNSSCFIRANVQIEPKSTLNLTKSNDQRENAAEKINIPMEPTNMGTTAEAQVTERVQQESAQQQEPVRMRELKRVGRGKIDRLNVNFNKKSYT